ncbi:surfeit locus protein 6 homolog [Trifolium pratense]|uniref:surfeit locus protein 6 homolog n=1 Tax=Trifolium pratense TaxID=57577 RepID=UPI001E695A39|nr:surfeit locus protein 6 homolog [Trifolium pratense]XP_045801330.1 surfeit locus protein 6 homolog [Trifolium pratense]
MKIKNKQKGVVELDACQDLNSMIHENVPFFDKLINLIPDKFYLPTDDDEKPWFQGQSKGAKDEAKKRTKENVKKSKEDRLDPNKSFATTLDLLKQFLRKENVNDSDEVEGVVKRFMSGLDGDDRSLTYEELRQRLHRKLEEFRSNSGNAKRGDRRIEFSEKKRKRDNETELYESKPKTGDSPEKLKKDATEAANELVFGNVKLQDGEMQGKKRKISKQQVLERAKKLEELKKNDPEKGEAIAKKEAWKAALKRASGIKVHDDPKLIKKSIKNRKKRKQKSAEEWEERIQSRDQLKEEKQQKRSANIAERIHDKKMRKIAKREKKLLRPGSEGRNS